MLLHCSPQPAGWRRRSGRMAGLIPLQVQLRRPRIQKPVQLLGKVTKRPTCSGFEAVPAAPGIASSFLSPSYVQMNISNYGEVKNSSNVMGVIRGSVEPGEADAPSRVWRTCFPFSLCRQVRDLRQPPGQLGARRHRPQQRHLGDAGAEQSAGHEGQAG